MSSIHGGINYYCLCGIRDPMVIVQKMKLGCLSTACTRGQHRVVLPLCSQSCQFCQQCILVSTREAVHHRSILVKHECGHAGNLAELTHILSLIHVHLQENHIWVLRHFGEFIVIWGNHFAGATPCCREVHHHQFVSSFLQDAIELFLQKNKTKYLLYEPGFPLFFCLFACLFRSNCSVLTKIMLRRLCWCAMSLTSCRMCVHDHHLQFFIWSLGQWQMLV